MLTEKPEDLLICDIGTNKECSGVETLHSKGHASCFMVLLFMFVAPDTALYRAKQCRVLEIVRSTRQSRARLSAAVKSVALSVEKEKPVACDMSLLTSSTSIILHPTPSDCASFRLSHQPAYLQLQKTKICKSYSKQLKALHEVFWIQFTVFPVKS